MKLVLREYGLDIVDSMIIIWVFASIFIAAGGFAIALSFGIIPYTEHPLGLWDYVMIGSGVLSLFSGIMLVYIFPPTLTSIDQKTGLITIRQKLFLKPGKTTQSLRLDEIAALKVLSEESYDEGTLYKLHFKLRDGSDVPLSSAWTNNERKLEKIKDAVSKQLLLS